MSNTTDFLNNNVKAIQVTIPSGQTESNAVELHGTSISGFWTPAALTGTSFTFKSENPITQSFLEVRKDTGIPVSAIVSVNGFYTLPPTSFYGVRKIKIVSNSSEGADRIITIQPYVI